VQVIWAIIVGAIVGFIARWISPSPHNPQGFVLTTVLGIIGSVVATFLGRAIHLYGPDQGAGVIASIVGALIVLWGWHTRWRGVRRRNKDRRNTQNREGS
jgi:uncharacterized membrane protein YeaQ/YmgE (transglycosylase-associated protein family)